MLVLFQHRDSSNETSCRLIGDIRRLAQATGTSAPRAEWGFPRPPGGGARLCLLKRPRPTSSLKEPWRHVCGSVRRVARAKLPHHPLSPLPYCHLGLPVTQHPASHLLPSWVPSLPSSFACGPSQSHAPCSSVLACVSHSFSSVTAIVPTGRNWM